MKLLSIFLSFLFSIVLINGQAYCDWQNWTLSDWPTNTTTQNFEQIIGTDYLGNSDFESGGRFNGELWTSVFFSNPSQYRPLGFKYAVLGANNNPTVCLNADGTASYLVELMVYSFNPVKLCAADINGDNYNSQSAGILAGCAIQYLYLCFTSYTSYADLKIAIYCSTGCEDNQQEQLLYRFRRSDISYATQRTYASNNPEMWCVHIAAEIEWPDELNDAVPGQYSASNSNYNSGKIVEISLTCILAICLFILTLL